MPLIFWLLALMAASLAVVGFIYRADISYTLQLLNAKRIADRFYGEYPGIIKNIAYGTLPREKLDIYQPQASGLYPVLIWVHGGSWNSGDKELYAPVAQKALSENFVIVIPGYTLYPQANAFQQAQEIAQVLAWTREHISAYGGDKNRIVLGGQSAGAHLSGLVVFDPNYLAALNHSSQEICGWYGIAGPYDINEQLAFQKTFKGDDGTQLANIFGGAENFSRGSLTEFVRADLPPILLIHGDRDETVPLSISQHLQNALRAAGAKSELKIYAGAGHAGLLFDALVQEKPTLIQDLASFIAASCQ